MSITAIGSNSLINFVQDYTFAKGYDETKDSVKDLGKNIEDEHLKDAFEGLKSNIASGLIMYLIMKEEDYMEKLFAYVGAKIMALIVLSRKQLDRYKNRKGIIGMFARVIGKDDTADKVLDVLQKHQEAVINARANFSSTQSVHSSAVDQKSFLVQRENHFHDIGKTLADRYHKIIDFKLKTGTFTASDRATIGALMGREVSAQLQLDELNAFSETYYIVDTAGNKISLPRAITEMVNALGYLHNKN